MLKSFYGDTSIAMEYGVSEAIFLNNIIYWLEKNAANGINYHDGRYWTFNSVSAFQKLFPFWTIQNVRTIIKKLKDKGILLTGMYNTFEYDKTVWYSLSDDFLKKHCPETGIVTDLLQLTNVQPSGFEAGIFPKETADSSKLKGLQPSELEANLRLETCMDGHLLELTNQYQNITKTKYNNNKRKKIVVDSSPPNIPPGLKEEITERIGEITETALKALLLSKGEEKIREKLSHWDRFAVTKIMNTVGFFIAAVNGDFPIPKSLNLNGYVAQKHNYEQRKYDDDFYNSLYEDTTLYAGAT